VGVSVNGVEYIRDEWCEQSVRFFANGVSVDGYLSSLGDSK